MSDPSENRGCLGFLFPGAGGGGSKGGGLPAGPWPFVRKRHLLSKAEFSFFRVLQASAPEKVVLAKVNLGDLLAVAKGTEKRQTWRNKIDRKHADFVLCDPETMVPETVVELDDASHGSKQAQERDEVKTRACEAASLPLVRVAARKSYNVAGVRAALGLPLKQPGDAMAS